MRRGLVLSILVLAGAAALALWFLDSRSERASEVTLAGDPMDEDTPAAPVLEGRQPGGAPRTAEPEIVLHDQVAQDRRSLGVKGYRKNIVRRLYDRDQREPALVPMLDEVIAATRETEPRVARTAMIVVMRTEGSARYLKDLAHGKTVEPGVATHWFPPGLPSPEHWRATYALYWHAARPETPSVLRGVLAETGDRMVEDTKAGVDRIREGLLRSRGSALRIWLDVAARVEPVPREYARAFAAALARAEGGERSEFIRLVPRAGAEAEWGGEGVGEAVSIHLVASYDGFDGLARYATVKALGYLDAATPEVLGLLLSQVQSGWKADAIEALGRLGPPAASVAEDLIAYAREHPRSAPSIAVAVAGMKTSAALGFLADFLETDARVYAHEMVAARLADVPGAAALAPVLLAEVQRGRSAALGTLVRWDEAASKPITRTALVAAMAEDQPPHLRQHALRLTKELTAIPDVVLEAMIDCLGAKEVAREAVSAVGDIGRFGPAALRWKDRMMRLQAEAETHGPPRGAIAAFNVLGELAGSHPDVRARLFDLLDRYGPGAIAYELDARGVWLLLGALCGLGGVDGPTVEQVRMVARIREKRAKGVKYPPGGGHAYMRPVDRVLGKPSWHRVRMGAGIELAVVPPIREPTWR